MNWFRSVAVVIAVTIIYIGLVSVILLQFKMAPPSYFVYIFYLGGIPLGCYVATKVTKLWVVGLLIICALVAMLVGDFAINRWDKEVMRREIQN